MLAPLRYFHRAHGCCVSLRNRILPSVATVTCRSLTYVSPGVSLLHHPESVCLGWSQESLIKAIPFTAELVSTRGRPFENIGVSYCPKQEVVKSSGEAGTSDKRITDDSWLEIVLPFAEQTALRESMERPNGQSIRYGKLFELLDALAGDVAYRHCGGGVDNVTIVTASVDGMKMFSSINILNDIRLQGYLTYVGKSSMEVTIDVISKVNPVRDEQLAEMRFIMVARRGDGAASVPGLILANELAEKKFREGAQRATTRRLRAQQSLSVRAPLPDEVELVHNLYIQSLEQKQQQLHRSRGVEPQMQKLCSVIFNNKDTDTASTVGVNADATATTDGSNAVVHSGMSVKDVQMYCNGLDLPPLRWMADTFFKSTLFMHIQDRNVHGKIFGGHIMKESFELAYIAAMSFYGGGSPSFQFIDDIQFVKPVSVGSIVEFTSTVTYGKEDHIVVQVVAATVDPADGSHSKTNVFNIVFRAPAQGTGYKQTPQVLPNAYDEIVLYLEGKRSLDAVLGPSTSKSNDNSSISNSTS